MFRKFKLYLYLGWQYAPLDRIRVHWTVDEIFHQTSIYSYWTQLPLTIVIFYVYYQLISKCTKKYKNSQTTIFLGISYVLGVYRVPDEVCDIQKSNFYNLESRRLKDFSIVGAHQACNHTCPTFCLDIYDPACAQIWSRNMKTYVYRPMINHCHIDLYSCVVGVSKYSK